MSRYDPRRPEPGRNTDESFPLSFAQERLLFVEAMESGSVHHNDGLVILLEGRLEEQVLRDAFDSVINRHDVLRTAYVQGPEGWSQVVQAPRAMEFVAMSAPHVSLDFADLELNELVGREMRRPLDLAAGIVCRAALYRVSERENALLITIHHLVCDLWSFTVFASELSELYAARLEGRRPVLPPIPTQYPAYAGAQRAAATNSRKRPHVNYWREKLSGAPTTHSLPLTRPRPRHQQFRGGVLRTTLPAALVSELFRLGRSRRLTPYMMLMAAFQYAVSQRSGEDDIVVMSPIATRVKPELENLIGCFLNFLPLRVEVDRCRGFASLADQVSQGFLDMWDHRELPFEDVVQAAQVHRSSSHQPIAQLTCVLQNTPSPTLRLPGVQSRFAQLETGRSRLDLSLRLTERDHGVECEWEYDNTIFDEEHVQRLALQFERVARFAVDDENRPLSALSNITDDEREVFLGAVNATERSSFEGHTIAELFAMQVRLTPESDAVVEGDRVLSYAGLDLAARRLAHVLALRGVQPGSYVAVCLPRGIEEVTAILAIMFAGGTYVPLDPHSPRARRDAILDAVDPTVVVSSGDTADEVWRPGVDLIDLDEVDLAECSLLPGREISPGDLAYVTFTSGSTGAPKGVMVTHEGFCNRMLWGQQNYALTTDDRVLRRAASTFDVSLDELFRALFNGAASIQMPPSRVFDPRQIADVIRRYAVTDADFSPTVLNAVLQLGGEDLKSLRRVVSGVEELPRELEQSVLARSSLTLFNLYGPTEVSVSCTHFRCVPGGSGPVPIGRPMSNVRVYVLDRNLQLVPPGVKGELYVGGAGLARGYLGAPDLTADSFLPDPFGPAGSRIYRTGDVVYWNSQRELCFAGRADAQLNINGFRIEPGEVVSALLSHPDVSESVVALNGPSGNEIFTGYVVLREDPSTSAEGLRQFLRDLLPSYMVPRAIIEMDRIPVNANGKIDHEALPSPHHASRGRTPILPGSETEVSVHRAWTRALGFDGFGVDDDYFELGGDSVKAASIMVSLSRDFQTDLRVLALFDSPTVRQLSTHIDRQIREEPRHGEATGI